MKTRLDGREGGKPESRTSSGDGGRGLGYGALTKLKNHLSQSVLRREQSSDLRRFCRGVGQNRGSLPNKACNRKSEGRGQQTDGRFLYAPHMGKKAKKNLPAGTTPYKGWTMGAPGSILSGGSVSPMLWNGGGGVIGKAVDLSIAERKEHCSRGEKGWRFPAG